MKSKLDKRPVLNQPVFFPYYFKAIGITIVLMAVAAMLLAKWLTPAFFAEHKYLMKDYFKSILLAGLFCFAWAREKFEDEMTFTIRLKAIGLALYFVMAMLLLEPFLRPVFGPGQMSLYRFVFSLLFFYLLFYYGSKWAADK